MGNISIMLKAYGKTRAQHVILEDQPFPKRKERVEQAGKQFQTSHSDSVTFPGRSWGQKKYPSKFSPHVEKALEFGRQDPCYKSYSSNTLQTWISINVCKSGVAIINCHYRWGIRDCKRLSTHQRTWTKGTENDTFETWTQSYPMRTL